MDSLSMDKVSFTVAGKPGWQTFFTSGMHQPGRNQLENWKENLCLCASSLYGVTRMIDSFNTVLRLDESVFEKEEYSRFRRYY